MSGIEERHGIRGRPRQDWRLTPERIASIHVRVVRYIPKNHGRCPCRNRTAPTGRTPPELKMECHLGKLKSRVVNLDWSAEAIDMILATPIRVRTSCAGREYPAMGLRGRSIRIIPVTGAAIGRAYLQAPRRHSFNRRGA